MASLEQGKEAEIIIARHGRPVAKLVPAAATTRQNRIGAAKGKFEVPEDIDAHNDEIAKLFGIAS